MDKIFMTGPVVLSDEFERGGSLPTLYRDSLVCPCPGCKHRTPLSRRPWLARALTSGACGVLGGRSCERRNSRYSRGARRARRRTGECRPIFMEPPPAVRQRRRVLHADLPILVATSKKVRVSCIDGS